MVRSASMAQTPPLARASRPTAPTRVPLEDAVPVAVAGLLRASDVDEMLVILRTLITSTGGALPAPEGRPMDVLRGLPDALRVDHGRELSLGPVLRALCAAAAERTEGALEPPPRGRPPSAAVGDHRVAGDAFVLVSLDLGDLGIARRRLGEQGAQLLLARMKRTLRTLLEADEPALRYPAGRFLLVLHRTTPRGAQAFAERASLEWSAFLGHGARVTTHQAEVVGGDVVAALRSLE
jgi:hypothetical protein